MDGRANRRVDKLLTLLLKFEEDMFFARQQQELMWVPNKVHTEENKWHLKLKALSLKNDDIKVSSRGVARGGQRGHLPPLFSRKTRVLSISK